MTLIAVLQAVLAGVLVAVMLIQRALYKNQKRLLENDKEIFRRLRDAGFWR